MREVKIKIDTIRKRAQELGVIGLEVDGTVSDEAILEAYESALNIIERNKERLDRNAGEVVDGQ